MAGFGGGEIRPESGETYCFKSNTTLGTNVGVRAAGSSYNPGSVIFTSCGTDTTILTLGTGGFVEHVNFICYGVGATKPCINVINPRVIIARNQIQGGAPNIAIAGSDAVVTLNRINRGYGNASVTVGNGAQTYFIRNIFNQPWPGGCTPTPHSIAIPGAYATGTTYAPCAIVSLSGYYIVTIAGLTSGGSPPTIPAGTLIPATINDNGGTWTLMQPSTYYGIAVNQGIAVEEDDDHSGSLTAGLALLGSTSAAFLTGNNLYAQNLIAGVYAAAGDTLEAVGTSTYTCVTTGCAGFYLGASFSGDASLDDIFSFSNTYGVQDLGGTNNGITHSHIMGNTTGIHVGAVNSSTISHNFVGSSVLMGANTNAMTFDSGSDYLTADGNNCFGASAGLVNNSTGSHNYVPTGGNPGC